MQRFTGSQRARLSELQRAKLGCVLASIKASDDSLKSIRKRKTSGYTKECIRTQAAVHKSSEPCCMQPHRLQRSS